MASALSCSKFISVVRFSVSIKICECCSKIMSSVECCAYKPTEKVHKSPVYHAESINATQVPKLLPTHKIVPISILNNLSNPY